MSSQTVEDSPQRHGGTEWEGNWYLPSWLSMNTKHQNSTQRRKDAKAQRVDFLDFLCVFAPLRLCVEFFLLTPPPCLRVSVVNSSLRTLLTGAFA